MAKKPTYEELEKRIQALAKESIKRTQAEEVLRESEEKHRSILENIEEGYFEVDIAGNLTFLNDALAKIHGYSRDEMMGINSRLLTSEENIEKTYQIVNTVFSTGKPVKDLSWEIIRKDGSKRYIETSIYLKKDKEDQPSGFRGITRDITERKQAEEALRESEEKYRNLVELPNDGIIIIQNGKVQFSNTRLIEMFGYSIEEMMNTPFLDFVFPDERSRIADIHKRRLQGEDIPAIYEMAALHKNGKKIDIETNSGIITYHGKPATLSFIRDITEHKQAEKELKSERDRSQQYLDLAGVIFVSLDRDQKVTLINKKGCEVLGYSEDEIVGKNWFDHFLPETNISEVKEIYDNLISGNIGPVEYYENPVLTKDGSEKLIAWHNSMLRDESGRIITLLSSGEDITERKRAEESLKESENLYRLLAENVTDTIWTMDMDLKFTYFSPSVTHMRGYSVEEAIAQPPEESMTPASFESAIKVIAEELELHNKGQRDSNRSRKMETELICKDGSTVWTEIEANFIYNLEGRPAVILGITRNITERKEAEKERKRAEEALHESEEKLARSKKMESLGLLAGGVAHDLNNILSGIVSYPELILMDLPEDSKFRKPIETIKESGHRAADIVQDLLTVARGAAITKEPLNLNDLVGEYLHSPEFNKLKQFHPTFTVKTNLDNELLNISGSDVHIRKVVMNLVSNASEAIDGRGNVTVSTMNRYIDRPLRGYDEVNIGEYAVLSVSDEGSGISPVDLERVFEPFYTKKVMGKSGTGLGLAVVWNVVQDHKGYIDVITDENGTTFELYFPITRDEISDKDLSIPIQDYKGNGEKILVVDDVESQRDISCKMLETLGYKTEAVSSGEEAAEYLKENTADLILLDMIMDPGINGRETYERIIEIHPNQKAIIVSGFAETDEVKEAQKLGAGKYIKKPYTIEKIGLAVKEELEKY